MIFLGPRPAEVTRVSDSDFTDEEFYEEIEGKTTTELMKLMFRL